MPFTLIPQSVTPEGTEVAITGRISAGALFGPEEIMVISRDDREFTTYIRALSLENPQGWPVLPEHGTIVTILIPPLPQDFAVKRVTGLGAVQEGNERIDFSDAFTQPEFWAYFATLHFVSDDVDGPGLEYLGISSDRTNEWYDSNIERHLREERWPYIRVPLPDGKYLEFEMSGGGEYQDRFWIGHQSGAFHALLGYHSGHFSLPAFRLQEVMSLAPVSGSAAMLWLSATYLEAGQHPLDLTKDLLAKIPGIRRSQLASLSERILANLAVKDLHWTLDPTLGWINNWCYSQRNPKSLLSTLKPGDFSVIQNFFR